MKDSARVSSARGMSVKDDWRAWLPDEKNRVFRACVHQLEVSYNVFSISLDEALELRQCGRVSMAGEAVCVTPDLCARFARPLVGLLWALGEHAKHHGTVPNAAPLDPTNFKGTRGQRMAKLSSLICHVILSERTQFLYKLNTLSEMVEHLSDDFCSAASGIATGSRDACEDSWKAADAVHYDLNTCFRETVVLLKSFLHALPDGELNTFQETARVQMGVPAPRRLTLAQRLLRHRRIQVTAGE